MTHGDNVGGSKNVAHDSNVFSMGDPNIENSQIYAEWSGSIKEVDIAALEAELKKLRGALATHGEGETETAIAAGALAQAEKAARERDIPHVFTALAGAGRWVLDVAKKIGVSVAAKAIEAAPWGYDGWTIIRC